MLCNIINILVKSWGIKYYGNMRTYVNKSHIVLLCCLLRSYQIFTLYVLIVSEKLQMYRLQRFILLVGKVSNTILHIYFGCVEGGDTLPFCRIVFPNFVAELGVTPPPPLRGVPLFHPAKTSPTGA